MIYVAYLISTVGGHLVAGLLVYLMRKTITPTNTLLNLAPKEMTFYYIWIGFIERTLTTTIFIWTPTQLGLFIGGWTALKLAAAWSRRTNDEDHTLAHLISLMGTAISLSVAIAAGMLISPESVDMINGTVVDDKAIVAASK